MGCSFYIYVQVRYGGIWVNIFDLGSSTPCGGYPLCAAPPALFLETGIDGTYCSDEPVADKDDEAQVHAAMGLGPKPKRKRKRKGNRKKSENEDEDWTTLYYSLDEFKELIKRIPRDPEDQDIYKQIMQPVPTWMKMALNCYPAFIGVFLAEIPDDIDDVMETISEHQQLLVDKYKEMLVKTMRGNPSHIPDDLVRYIADFASPRGDDVRITWSDIEGNYRDLTKKPHIPRNSVRQIDSLFELFLSSRSY